MMQEESRMAIHAEPSGSPGARSALAASSSGITSAKGGTRRCYNYGETGHFIKACPRPPKERDASSRGQFAIRGRGRGGRRGGRGGNRANLMVGEEEEGAIVGLSEEDLILEIVRRRQKGASEEKSVVDDASTTSSSRGNVASVTYSATGTCNTSMALGVAEMLWLKRLLEDLKVKHEGKMKLWCDSKSAISIANNPVQDDKTKHVEIDRFFIKEKLEIGLLELSHVATKDQVADCLTKGLSSIDLVRLCDKMGLIDIFCPS